MTRSKKAAKKASSPVIDPYLPANGNFGYRVSRYELELEYKVTINRLSGVGHHHGRYTRGIAAPSHWTCPMPSR